VTNLVTYVELNHFSGGILTADIWHTICQSTTTFGSVGSLANRNLFPEFRELWSWVRDTM